jgi:hypothetical protein
MLRTILAIGLFAVLGLFALKMAFGILGTLFAILAVVLMWALKFAAVGLVIYLLIRIFSPETARRLREKWSGPAV